MMFSAPEMRTHKDRDYAPEPRVALVLAGGGAKGAFQAEMVHAITTSFKFNYAAVAGVSVGALNGAMVAQRRIERMRELWSTITEKNVFQRRSLLRLASNYGLYKLGLKSPDLGAYINKPLLNLIRREISLSEVFRFETPLLIGRVNLNTGKYANYITELLHEEILASTAIPIVWQPSLLPPDDSPYVDGGVRNIAPLGDVLEYDPDLVIVVPCDRLFGPMDPSGSPGDIIDVALRTIEIMTNETLRQDIKEFQRINDLVLSARSEGVYAPQAGR